MKSRIDIRRFYCVPHGLHEVPLSKAGLSVMIALFKLRDDFLSSLGGRTDSEYFSATNERIAKIAKVSTRTVKRIKPKLYLAGLIKYWSPNRREGNVSKYEILDGDK